MPFVAKACEYNKDRQAHQKKRQGQLRFLGERQGGRRRMQSLLPSLVRSFVRTDGSTPLNSLARLSLVARPHVPRPTSLVSCDSKNGGSKTKIGRVCCCCCCCSLFLYLSKRSNTPPCSSSCSSCVRCAYEGSSFLLGFGRAAACRLQFPDVRG